MKQASTSVQATAVAAASTPTVTGYGVNTKYVNISNTGKNFKYFDDYTRAQTVIAHQKLVKNLTANGEPLTVLNKADGQQHYIQKLSFWARNPKAVKRVNNGLQSAKVSWTVGTEYIDSIKLPEPVPMPEPVPEPTKNVNGYGVNVKYEYICAAIGYKYFDDYSRSLTAKLQASFVAALNSKQLPLTVLDPRDKKQHYMQVLAFFDNNPEIVKQDQNTPHSTKVAWTVGDEFIDRIEPDVVVSAVAKARP